MRTKPNQQPSVVFSRVEAGYDGDIPVFSDFNLKLSGPGTFHISGVNGSGKSTFIELLSGYLKPWQGSIVIGQSVAHLETTRDLRSVCRTRPALYSNMTAHDHLYFAGRVAGVSPEDLLVRAAAYGLTPWLHASANSLSTGNMKKLWLIMCTPTPRLVTALDEPFDALDQDGIDLLQEEISVWAKFGLVLIVAHQVPTALIFDQVVALPLPNAITRGGDTSPSEYAKETFE